MFAYLVLKEMSQPNKISNKIKVLRQKLNLSQDRFGKKIGVTGKAVSSYETGRCTPSLRTLERIAEAYNTSFVSIKDERKTDLFAKIKYVKDVIADLENDILN